ncbi:MAG TPA: pyridoxamine 5'-phosphate oxidase family protein [Roseiflexaceae bacterium]|nr:pyridoxamine 5'-phosphate oxidase family protein [Roseiflexaceae bacterium]
MSGRTIEQWEHTQAELEIRRWLSTIGLWAPGAEHSGLQAPDPVLLPRTLTPEEIDQALGAEVIGRIGCHADGKTYVVPVAYAYDGQAIYGQSGEGLKLRMLRASPEVCFEVDQIEHLGSWRSVIAWGWFEELHGTEADRALHLLVERIRPFLLPHAEAYADADATLQALNQMRPMIYRIKLGKRTGRALSISDV